MMIAAKVLYLGDTALDQAASYLAGIMSYYKLTFDYVSSNEKFCNSLLKNDYKAIIISDYPSANFLPVQVETLTDRIRNGLGFLMIGGWESFVGAGGNYNKTLLADCLPVQMSDSDDRMNCSSPCLVIKNQNHSIAKFLPFETNAPAVGGFNKVKTKTGGIEILSARQFKAEYKNSKFSFTELQTSPLLVIGNYGKANVAAFTSDVAPHWVGPLVDWGDTRITAKAQGSAEIEVGNWYVQLFINIVRWVCKEL